MAVFLEVAPFWLKALVALGWILVFAYGAWKVAARGYLYSPYMIVVLTYAVTVLVIGPVQYNDEAWQVLGRENAVPFYDALNLSLSLNAGGFCLALAMLWSVEARRTKAHLAPFYTFRRPITPGSYVVVLGVAIAIFATCLAVVGTIPLFGNRTVFYDFESLRPLYNFANFVILYATSVLVVYSFSARDRRYVPMIALGVACMFLTGSRASALATLELVAIMATLGFVRRRRARGTLVLTAGLGGIAVLGLFIASFRTGSAFSMSDVWGAALYGNTFSDVRDGAYVAHAWQSAYSGEHLAGKTYLAGLLSFIPSQMSALRANWSWGYFSTEQLFGFGDHFGFRPGWSVEGYMNFGVVGAVCMALLFGWILGRLEKNFYGGALQGDARYPTVYASGWLGYTVFTSAITSSATYNFYSLAVATAGAWLVREVARGLGHRAPRFGEDVISRR